MVKRTRVPRSGKLFSTSFNTVRRISVVSNAIQTIDNEIAYLIIFYLNGQFAL